MIRFITLAIILIAIAVPLGMWLSRQVPPEARRMLIESAAGAGAEECGFALAGSNTIGEKLAPAAVAAYLASRGYETAEPRQTAPEETRVVGVHDDRRCTIDVRAHGSGYSFEALQAGDALIGMSSRPIRESEIADLRAAGAGDFAAEAALAEHVVALDGIAIIVHPSNPLREIPKQAVKDLFTGAARDWRAVGGPPGAVTLYARDDHSGTFQFFHEHVLEEDAGWERAKQNAHRYSSSAELVSAVALDPSAIGFVGMAYVNGGVRALSVSDGGPPFSPRAANVRAESYPISRRLFLYVRPDTMRENTIAAGLINYFKAAAVYDLVEQLQYVSLRPFDAVATAAAEQVCSPGTPEAEIYRIATAGGERLSSVIRFLPGSNEVDALGRDDILRIYPDLRDRITGGDAVKLIGHTDSEGESAANRQLAMQRAGALRALFEGLGVFGLQVDSAGEMCPVAGNDTPQRRQANRRVEIWIVPRRAG